MDYQKQAEDFLAKTGTSMRVTFICNGPYFEDDEEDRDSFLVSFNRVSKRQRIRVRFGQSLDKSTGCGDKPPTAYDVLACLTKNDPGSFDDFCSEFGYSNDSIKALSTYKAVVSEWKKVKRIWGDCLSELEEIQ